MFTKSDLEKEKILSAIQHGVEARTEEVFGSADELLVPEGCTTVSTMGATAIYPRNVIEGDKLDQVIVSLHSGIKLPLNQFDLLRVNQENPQAAIEDTAESIFLNKDLGINLVLSALLRKLATSGSRNWAVISYEYSRLIDPNRINSHNQIPQEPYQGEGIWQTLADYQQKKIIDNTIHPFIFFINAFFQSHGFPSTVLFPHSYDQYPHLSRQNPGVINNGKPDEARPPIEIIQAYPYAGREYLLTPEQLTFMQSMLAQYLAELPAFDGTSLVSVDEPYGAPNMLPITTLSDLYAEIGQIFSPAVFEIRKDLLEPKTIAEQGINHWAEMLYQVMIGMPPARENLVVEKLPVTEETAVITSQVLAESESNRLQSTQSPSPLISKTRRKRIITARVRKNSR